MTRRTAALGPDVEPWPTRIRRHLADSRAQRLTFAAAWTAAVAAHPPEDEEHVTDFARRAFHAGYHGYDLGRGLPNPEPEGSARQRVPVVTGGEAWRCRDGDGCDRKRAQGSQFCEYHHARLRQWAGELKVEAKRRIRNKVLPHKVLA